jgi:subtilisin family serine protease
VFNNSGTTSSVGGTSIATPELAGLAACLWETNPKATPYQIRKAIRESGHIASSPNNQMGFGVPDFGKASLSLKKVFDTLTANNIYVFPSPFTEKITVNVKGTSSKGALQWSIYNLQGQKIMEATKPYTDSSFLFEITPPSNLPKGVYVLQLNNQDYNKTLKIIKE